ncbi:hypothetical protein ACGFIV_32220, partial [Sphaerisporangium sp. NPDC049003]|uniref:hypothetical protein n=1 Tax=Sphaerisporangium sp. NPDC049003 TaxID=3364517 RepID=UPI00371CA228
PRLQPPTHPQSVQDGSEGIKLTKSQTRRGPGEQVVRSAAEAHVDDLVGVDLDFGGPTGAVMFPFALYLGFGHVDPRKDPTRCAQGCDHETLDEDERDEYEHPDEYEALCHVTSSVFGDDFESAGPGRFSNLVGHPHWSINQIRTSGAFSLTPYEKDDFINALRGNDGGAQVIFYSSASTKIASRWSEFRNAAMGCLETNEDWTELVGGWLDTISELPDEYDVRLHIYNPCDLMATLVYGLPESIQEYEAEVITKSLREYVPMFVAVATPRNKNSPSHLLKGKLGWNGIAVPALRRRIKQVYKDPWNWHIAKATGVAWQADRELLDLLGMHYVADVSVLPPYTQGGIEEHDTWTLLPQDLNPETVEKWGGLFGIANFIERHREEVFLLVQEYRQRLRIVDTRNLPSE